LNSAHKTPKQKTTILELKCRVKMHLIEAQTWLSDPTRVRVDDFFLPHRAHHRPCRNKMCHSDVWSPPRLVFEV
jgi:hypothetical protein